MTSHEGVDHNCPLCTLRGDGPICVACWKDLASQHRWQEAYSLIGAAIDTLTYIDDDPLAEEAFDSLEDWRLRFLRAVLRESAREQGLGCNAPMEGDHADPHPDPAPPTP